MAMHLVLSRQADGAHPGRLALAEGEGMSLLELRAVSSTDDPDEFVAILRVLIDGGEAPHPRIEREWGRQLRELHALVAAARGQAITERQTGSLGQRLHGGHVSHTTGSEGAGPDKPA